MSTLKMMDCRVEVHDRRPLRTSFVLRHDNHLKQGIVGTINEQKRLTTNDTIREQTGLFDMIDFNGLLKGGFAMSTTYFTEEQVLSLAQEAYRVGTAQFTIVSAKCTLLVIDMQDEFVKPGWTPYWVPEATRQVPKIKILVERCRAIHVPVIFTVASKTNEYLDRPISATLMAHRYPELEIDQSLFFIEGHVWHELAPLDKELVIHKPSYGAFYNTPLETILRNLEKDTVIICGTLTNYCCGTTARQAYDRGFKVVFGSDVTSTDDPAMQEPELMVLRKGFAKVLSAQQILDNL